MTISGCVYLQATGEEVDKSWRNMVDELEVGCQCADSTVVLTKTSCSCKIFQFMYMLKKVYCKVDFHGAWLSFQRGYVFSAAVCKIQASKRYIESLPLVLKR